MRLEWDGLVLRDMEKTDVEDYVRWFTVETEWSDFDAPWEPVSGNEAEERQGWTEYYEAVKDLSDDKLRWKFEVEYAGRHVGWVSSYLMDEAFQWISADAVGPEQTVHRAVGIDLCEPDVWNGGIGTKALRAFMQYYFDRGAEALYTQTWSGNVRMLRCAEKLGFAECNRNVGTREVGGKQYDGLTFRLDKK